MRTKSSLALFSLASVAWSSGGMPSPAIARTSKAGVRCRAMREAKDCAYQMGSAHCRRPRRIPGFSDFWIFRKMWILGFFRWDLGSGRVCNRLEMAVGFKWTDSQLISSLLSPFSIIFMIIIIYLIYQNI